MAKKGEVKMIKTTDDSELGKVISIKCQGADVIELDDLTDFQGGLKILSDESYEKLKKSILDLGFSFPIAAWKDRNKTFILDAHQRVTTLKKMRDEGYVIPKLPVIWVYADDRQEAAKKLLAATSQFGEITVSGLYNFMDEFKLDVGIISTNFNFPEIDFNDFKNAYFPDISDQKNDISMTKSESKELSEEDFKDFDKECPKCGFQWD